MRILPILISSAMAFSANAAELTKQVNSLGMELVEIPAGEFYMGQALGETWQEGGEWDEVPIHEVVISQPFWMGSTEVTNAQYEQFDPEHRKLRGKSGFSSEDDEPVVQVSWHDAMAFCEWLSQREGKPYRLPTEAEWEYACRAGTNTPYFTGESLPPLFRREQTGYDDWKANHRVPVSLVVAQSPVNPWGLYDMHGNVEEWCMDWYGAYEGKKATDPLGRESGVARVVRGGSHNTDVYYLRSANRMSAIPDERNYLLGFRVVQADIPTGDYLPAESPTKVMTNVSQETAANIKSDYDPNTPYFKGPRSFVKLPDSPQGPIFSFHNHDPALIDCPNGDLLAIWYSTQREWGPELSVVGSRLRAGNEEWEEASLFFDLADRNEHGPAFWKNDEGHIYHFNGVGISGWDDIATIMRISKDNGATWSAPEFVKSERRPPSGCVESVILTKSGKLLLPLDGRGSSTELVISGDAGKTWVNPSDGKPASKFEAGATGAAIAGIHAAVVELDNGDWYAIGRGSNIDGRSPMSLSKDEGQTWSYSASELPPSGVGQRPLLLRLEEGPILYIGFTDVVKKMGDFELGVERERTLNEKGMEVVDAGGETRKVYGMFAALSFDEGKTWPIKKIITPGGPPSEHYGHGWTKAFVLDEDHAEPMGYPSITQAQDGQIHLISSGLHYAFNLAWLKEPMPVRK